MKLSSVKPNAFYDLKAGKPKQIEYDNDGSFLFRFNISKHIGIPEGEEVEKQIGWKCCEVRVWGKASVSSIKQKVVDLGYSNIERAKLEEDYNKHTLGVKINENAVKEYIEYLNFTEEVESVIVKYLAQ